MTTDTMSLKREKFKFFVMVGVQGATYTKYPLNLYWNVWLQLIVPVIWKHFAMSRTYPGHSQLRFCIILLFWNIAFGVWKKGSSERWKLELHLRLSQCKILGCMHAKHFGNKKHIRLCMQMCTNNITTKTVVQLSAIAHIATMDCQ